MPLMVFTVRGFLFMPKNKITFMRRTVDNIMVRPFNNKAIKSILPNVCPKLEKDEYHIDSEAIVVGTPLTTDSDCCHYDNTCDDNSITYAIGIRIERFKGETENGVRSYSLRMDSHDYILKVDLPEAEEKGLLMPEITLREYMGKRFNYNPRIHNNTRILLNNVEKYFRDEN